MSSLPGATAKKRGSMPLLRPKSHSGSNTILMHNITPRRRKRRGYSPAPLNAHSAPHKFATGFDTQPGKQGLYVREADGSYMYYVWSYDEALKKGYADKDIFVIGRDGYYLTMAEARKALPADVPLDDPTFVHGVHYVDDFNDEWQDFYICAEDGVTPEPYEEAHAHEPIQ
jgi:hypothetical protein